MEIKRAPAGRPRIVFMSTDQPTNDEPEYLFLRSDAAAKNAFWWFVGGLAALAGAAVGFIVALVARVDQLSLHLMTTLPTLIGLGAITAGWTLARTPNQVAVGPGGLRIEGKRERRSYAWSQIGWATVGTGSLNQRRQLVVYDTEGKTIAQLSEAFDGFDTLVELVKQRIADKGDDTAERIRTRKAKRSALLTAAVAVALLAAGGGLVWMTYREQRAARLLEQVAVPGEAEIVRRFLAPNGITPRLEYRVTTPAGRSATRNAEVTRPYWDSLEGAASVPVRYVPDEPKISRLVTGEPEETDITRKPLFGYGLSAAVSVLSLVLLGAAWLQWCGWDIDLDSKTGKLSIQRFGSGQ
jgi:hypothetical protein